MGVKKSRHELIFILEPPADLRLVAGKPLRSQLALEIDPAASHAATASLPNASSGAGSAPAQGVVPEPCTLRLHAGDGVTGTAYIARDDASEPCPVSLDPAVLDAQRPPATSAR